MADIASQGHDCHLLHTNQRAARLKARASMSTLAIAAQDIAMTLPRKSVAAMRPAKRLAVSLRASIATNRPLTQAAAREIARDIAVNTAPLSVAITKRLLWESPNLTPAEVGQRETELHHHVMGKPDAIEGAMAYLEKRSPRWQLSPTRDWPEWPD